MSKSIAFFLAAMLSAMTAVLANPLLAADVVFEAEDFSSEGGLGFYIMGDAHASNGAVISTKGNTTGWPDATVTYDLDFSTPGNYYLYGRLYAPDPPGGLADSFYVPPDFGTYAPYDTSFVKINNSDVVTPAAYLWHNITLGVSVPNPPPNANGRSMIGNAPVYTVTSPGTYSFSLGGREDGLIMDAFVLSTSPFLNEGVLDSLVDLGVVDPPRAPLLS